MHKRIIIGLISIICVTVLIVVFSTTALGENVYYLAGLYMNKAQSEANRNTIGTRNDIVAEYHGHTITMAEVNYYRDMNVIRDNETRKKYTKDKDVINRIVEDIILYEEAERLNLTATTTEIDNMVNNTISAYAIPEGKEMIDSYLAGAELSFDEYLEMLRQKAPVVIAKQKLLNEIGKQYCQENGLEYTNVNPPEAMLKAQEKYVEKLLKAHASEIRYYLGG